MSVDADALTTLTGVKVQLGITDTASDTLLTDLINAVSKKIKRIAGREFVAADYVQWFAGLGQESFAVDEYPIVGVSNVCASLTQCMTVSYSGSAIRKSVAVGTSSLVLKSTTAAGVTTTSTLTFATYPTVSTLATAITAVSGWTATVVADRVATHLVPRLYGIQDDAAVQLYGADLLDVEADIDYAAGIVTLRPGLHEPQMGVGGYRVGRAGYGGSSAVMIDYRGGYETIPSDLEQLARELVQQAYQMGQANLAVESESLGGYSYSLTDAVTLTEGQRAVLRLYSRGGIA